jgi:hypothetical protein
MHGIRSPQAIVKLQLAELAQETKDGVTIVVVLDIYDCYSLTASIEELKSFNSNKRNKSYPLKTTTTSLDKARQYKYKTPGMAGTGVG